MLTQADAGRVLWHTPGSTLPGSTLPDRPGVWGISGV
jgi:hypothetical protein